MAVASTLRTRLQSILDAYLRIDTAIDGTLGELAANTEASAIATISQVRQLHDSATRMAALADGSDSKSSGLGDDLAAMFERLADVGTFVENLPERMERDLQNAKIVGQEMQNLSGMVEAIRTISVKSQILAVNTAVEAGRAGEAGATFQVMAAEMRLLAADAKSVAAKIIQGLGRASQIIESGIAESITVSAHELTKVSDTTKTITSLRDKLADMNSQHRSRLSAVARHNASLAADIADVLGHIQYQDIVRQSIELIRSTVEKRNACLWDAVAASDSPKHSFAHLPQQLELIFNDYHAINSNHNRVAQHGSSDGGLKIELF